jgi:hypothetical protein
MDSNRIEHIVKQLNDTAKENGESLGDLLEKVSKVVSKKDASAFTKQFANEVDVAKVKAVRDSGEYVIKMSSDNFLHKDATLTSNLTGVGFASYSQTPSVRGRRLTHFRNIPGVEVIPAEYGVFKYYRNSPPNNTGSFSTQTEGQAKPLIDHNWTEVTITVSTESGIARVSDRMMRDLTFLKRFLPSELQEDYLRNENVRFINSLMASTSSYVTTATVYGEKIIEWAGAILSRDYDPTAIVTTAANWSALLNTKPADYTFPGGTTIGVSPEGYLTIATIPLVVNNSLPTSRTMIGDFSRVKIIQSNEFNVRFFEQDSDNIQKGIVTARAEADVALAVLRSDWGIYSIS